MSPMTRARALGLALVLAGTAGSAWAQKNAETYFHAGSHLYVAGRHQEAAIEIEEGLRHWPEDPRLQALAGHLEDMKDQQRRGDDGQEDEGDSGEREPREGDGSGEGSPEDGEADPDDGEDRDEQTPDSGQDEHDRQPPQPSQQPQEPRPGEMSEEEAKRLLDSFADDDKEQQRGQRVPLGTRPDMEQTW